tara:strand:- start:382 stop:855 length:474 start_codon:yes stop_codon:yes gene_type:complete
MKQVKINIDKQTNSEELSKKLSELGAKNILGSIDLITNNQAKFIKQDSNNVTYAKKISKKESRISWQDSAEKNLAKINGLNPTPGAWFEYKGLRYKIWRAKIVNTSAMPGEIIDENLIIACKNQALEVIEIQKENKKKLLISDFLKGTKIPKGEIIY